MAQKQNKTYRPGPFAPNTSFTGAEQPMLVHGENMWVRFGKFGTVYADGYTGHLDLNEDIPGQTLTGTLSWDSTTKTVSGSGGTVFHDELHIGQFVLADGGAGATVLLVVEEVVDNDTFLATEAPPTTGSGSGTVMPVVFAVGAKRGTAVSGNVIQFIKGHFLGVGKGTFRLNGQALNASFTLSRTPKFALYDPTTGTYTINDVGIALPGAAPHISVAAYSPAVDTQMRAGSHSIRVMARNTKTNGYSNPSDAIAPVTITAGDQIEVTFINAMGSDQDAWDIYASESNDSSTTNIDKRYHGPWYFVKTVTAADLVDGTHPTGREAGTVHRFNFQDGEIVATNRLISFNNFLPDDALFVDSVNGIPIYFSCLGKGDATRTDGTAPGPSAIPSKPSNPEGAFLDKALSMAENDYIIGEMQFRSRIFCLGQMSLQVIVLTTVDEEPIAFRSLWNVGFRNPYAAAGFKEYIYGYSTAGMVRSVAGGDDSEVEFKFDADVKNYVGNYDAGKVLVRYDPKNKAMVYFFSAYEKRNGYWVTVALPFLIDEGVFNMPIVLSAPDRDFIVSGVATVGQELIMLAGGRTSGGTVEFGTYVFDGGSGETKNWFMCFNYSDDGLDTRMKRVHGAAMTARLSNGAEVKVYSVAENGEFKLTDLQNGTNEDSSIDFSATTGFLQRRELTLGESPPGALYAVRVEGNYTGSTVDTVDRLDELVIQVDSNSADG